MTFEQFQATRHIVADALELDPDGTYWQYFLYCDDELYIGVTSTDMFELVLGNIILTNYDLRTLEVDLYEYGISEGYYVKP